MALVSCTAALKMDTGLVEDYPTNTWWFDDDDGTTEPTIEAALISFYTSIASRFPSTMETNGHTFTWYRQSDPPPRAPIRETTWNLGTAPSGSPLPPECAICLSFQADRISGVPQARRRGRVFLGTLNVGCVDSDGRPASAAVTQIRNAGQSLLTASQSSTTWKWAVFSRVLGTASDVADGWVDNSFDTQRRRGIAPNARSTFT